MNTELLPFLPIFIIAGYFLVKLRHNIGEKDRKRAETFWNNDKTYEKEVLEKQKKVDKTLKHSHHEE